MKSVYKPIWSKQHGAYIILSISWLISTIKDGHLEYIHWIVLLFLLSGLNAADLLAVLWKRIAQSSYREKLWLGIYSGLSVLTGIYLLLETQSAANVFIISLLGGIIYTVLSKFRMQKSIVAEWIVFSILVLAGTLAYRPFEVSDFSAIYPTWILLSFYFGVSIFGVKYRIKEIDEKPIVIYLLISAVLLFFLVRPVSLLLLIYALMILKSIPIIFKHDWYRKMKLQHIGFMETSFTVFLVMFLAV